MERSIWIRDDYDIVEAIGQVLLRVQTEDVNTIYLSNGAFGDTLNLRQINKEQLIETLAKWSLAYTMYYVEVEQVWTRNVLFAFTESKDGNTNITWEVIDQIVNMVSIWRRRREKMGIAFTKPW
jgi:hypothetical protein